ncbi:DUF4190 domain-containing protein [Hahella sp. KA22]|uniref:DUF4190 domain-containing protein n=1 Tax=Hahella sp. KA22 TaxID=1628392 RepID=UPI000FDEDED3|nr:DUF4190 domain-containing protein [Hahella sp. KA22]AZZ95189.1 DUF4190 domain-containing protein [Hahella sp. KA22]QAY52834.1 DUF4190 domain-containing protein [Hahella sp. KA22]
MDGVVLDINHNNREGVLRCHQGNRYAFSLAEWKSQEAPRRGDKVDFLPLGTLATEIYFLERAATAEQPSAPSASAQATGPAPAAQTAPPSQPRERPSVSPSSDKATFSHTSGLAVTSFIFSLIGLFFFGSLVAIICGHIALHKIRESAGVLTGAGLAITGLVLGYLGLLGTILWIGYQAYHQQL